jgi:hypothetical protein
MSGMPPRPALPSAGAVQCAPADPCVAQCPLAVRPQQCPDLLPHASTLGKKEQKVTRKNSFCNFFYFLCMFDESGDRQFAIASFFHAGSEKRAEQKALSPYFIGFAASAFKFCPADKYDYGNVKKKHFWSEYLSTLHKVINKWAR